MPQSQLDSRLYISKNNCDECRVSEFDQSWFNNDWGDLNLTYSTILQAIDE